MLGHGSNPTTDMFCYSCVSGEFSWSSSFVLEPPCPHTSDQREEEKKKDHYYSQYSKLSGHQISGDIVENCVIGGSCPHIVSCFPFYFIVLTLGND